MLKWKDKITKLPIRKNLYSIIDYEHNNVGILTGHINNIIVLDVDVSDNGLKTFEAFEKEYRLKLKFSINKQKRLNQNINE